MSIVLLSVCICLSVTMSLIFCLCWKKKNSKDEWLGVDGMVTQKNPDENVNHLPSVTPCTDNVSNEESGDKKRSNVTNTRRSLPDIPSEMVTNWEPIGDNSSEHYATLGQYQNSGKKLVVTNGVEAQTAGHSSPYERVKYDKIKSKEHPYAQVQPTTSRHEENHPVVEERVFLLRADGASTSVEVTAPVRSRRSSAHSGCGIDIPAATAVAGGIPANYDLPYMTPPVTQANFSGDSHDSSKGYTSISVREPLANILAQTKETNKQKKSLDIHYSTVSDDSDDVYTTIPDPNGQIYTSESETYARIPPLPILVDAEINIPSSSERRRSEREAELYEPPPQPVLPSNIDRHTHTHSRQASSSSSIAYVGSPKPEKRQANSPLPPPPPPTATNLDDLYAKVHKNKKDETNEEISKVSLETNFIEIKDKLREKVSKKKNEHDYETLRKTLRLPSDPDYEKIKEPGYASINGPESFSDPGYEVLRDGELSEADPNYEQLQDRLSHRSDVDGYSKVHKTSTDGYSAVIKKKRSESFKDENDPNYESMPSRLGEPTYAGVKSSGSSDTDPNYESVGQHDPNYESVRDLKPPYEKLENDLSRTNSDISGYEKIKSNIRSAESSTDNDPPYERLHNNSDSEPGYERVDRRNEGNSSGSSGHEIAPIRNEVVDNDIADYIHEEDAVVQV